MENAFPGLTAMSSGFASVRADDGLCKRHGYYLAAWDRCGDFERIETANKMTAHRHSCVRLNRI